MQKIRLSCVIPSYKDPLSMKTVQSLLDNSQLGDQLEVIVVLDGYWPSFTLIEDRRVRYVHLGTNRGMRGAINSGVAVARGKLLMRSDEHCKYSMGYDKELVKSCKFNEMMTLKRYFLNPVTWEYMDIRPVECEKLVIQDCGGGVRKFSGQRWDSRAKRLNEPIIEGQALQGSMWCMWRWWWDRVIGELQTDGFGPTYQDSVEMSMKTWQRGGRLVWNRNAHYGHKHRTFPRTHQEGSPENPSNREASWKYALDQYEEYYKNVLLPKWKDM